jgi:biopolymer transport protein ExbB
MKKYVFTLVLILVLLSPALAKDLRQAAIEAKKQLEASQIKDKTVRTDIRRDKAALVSEIQKFETRINTLTSKIQAQTERLSRVRSENAELEKKSAQSQNQLDELSGAVRVAAGNLKALLEGSVYTAQNKDRLERLAPILDNRRFPGLDDMTAMAELFIQEMGLTAGIDLNTRGFVSDTGEQIQGKVLTLGGFTTAYQQGEKTGFLNYSQDSHTLYALSALPSRKIQKNLARYMAGESDTVYIDISRGAALRQITHTQSLGDQIEKGGILVWPILALGLFAALIGIERTLFLGRVHSNTDKVMGRVNQLAAEGAWENCHEIVGKKKIPVYNVLRAGLNARKENRETLESILQESILKEMPRLEKFLPLLNIMGAIAPLLGLLGTVTGMIATFHVITVYGTGDPRMMSGGISTALVTTMLGLSVAIPIMLLYTFLCRQVEHVIGDMEEKAVALTNIIFREAI